MRLVQLKLDFNPFHGVTVITFIPSKHLVPTSGKYIYRVKAVYLKASTELHNRGHTRLAKERREITGQGDTSK